MYDQERAGVTFVLDCQYCQHKIYQIYFLEYKHMLDYYFPYVLSTSTTFGVGEPTYSDDTVGVLVGFEL